MTHTTRRSFLTSALAAGVYPSDGIRREKLKITDIKVTPLSYVDPNKNLWRGDRYIVWKTDAALCQVFTDQGIVGIGEGTPYAGPDRIKQYTEETIKPALVGQNPFDLDLTTCGGTDQLSRASWAGVNNACWDIIGKAKNTPVYKLLAQGSRPSPRIRIYASGGDYHEWYGDGEKTLIEEALRYKEMGFTAFKFRAGTDWRYSNMNLAKYIPN
jgi:galactonate dehydratase